jgi:hypothetical protein
MLTRELLYKKIKKVKKYEELYKIPFDNKKKTNVKDVKVAIICAACNGFGDYVYALKIYNYMKKWYGISPVIFTNNPKYFLDNGIRNLYGIKIPGKEAGECTDIRLTKIYSVDKNGKFLKRVDLLYRFDIMAICPFIDTDFTPSHKVIQKLFPYANRFNSLLFSTYNVSNPKLFDFPTGLGDGYLGLLLSDTKPTKRNTKLKYPYIMVHISSHDSVDVTKCFSNFIKLMCKKYSNKHRILDIVTPRAVLEDKERINKLKNYIINNGYYDDVVIIESIGSSKVSSKVSGKILRLRFDILPLPYNKYISLFDHCLPDVLLTGNQSITDVISCCKYYNVYYQIMPWESSFARNLNNILKPPGDYLRKMSTSCGLEKMNISQKSRLIVVKRDWDFRILARGKLDSIIYNIKSIQNNELIKSFVDIVNNSRKKSSVLSKFKQRFF